MTGAPTPCRPYNLGGRGQEKVREILSNGKLTYVAKLAAVGIALEIEEATWQRESTSSSAASTPR